MPNLGAYILLFFVGGILLYAALQRVPVFDCFCKGAKESIAPAFALLPTLLALLFAVHLFSASGLPQMLGEWLSPLLSKIGIPKELLSLCILSPLSGSGSISVYTELLKTYGPDSFLGRTASVIAASTETTFYAIAVYYGSVGIQKTRHTVPCALCADVVSFILAGKFVSLFFN